MGRFIKRETVEDKERRILTAFGHGTQNCGSTELDKCCLRKPNVEQHDRPFQLTRGLMTTIGLPFLGTT